MTQDTLTPDIGMCVGTEYYSWPHDFIEEAKSQGISKVVPKTAIPDVEGGRTRIVLAHPRGIVTTTGINGLNLWDLAMEVVREYVVGTNHEPTPENKAEILSRWFPLGIQNIDEDEAWILGFTMEYLVAFDDDSSLRNKLGLCYWLRESERRKDLVRLTEKYGIEFAVQPCGLVKSCAECPKNDAVPCEEIANLGWICWSYLTGVQYIAKEGESEIPVELAGKGVEIVTVTYEEDTND